MCFFYLFIYLSISGASLIPFHFFPYLQDDIIPRLSVASLMRLRNEIAQTDW